MFNPSDLLEDHHLQRFSPLPPGPRNTGELTGTEQQSHPSNRDRDRVHVHASAQAQVAQLLRERERERDGQKQHGGVGAPQSYRDIFEMGGGGAGGDGAPGADRLAMRDVERDIPREELAIHHTNSSTGTGVGVGVGVGVGNVNVNGSTDYSEFDQFLQSTNWARMGGAGPVPVPNSNSHGHGHHGGHDFQNPSNNMSRSGPNAYPANAAMFMMGAGNMNVNMAAAANMNMANMSNMGMFNAPMPFGMNPMMYQQHPNSLYRQEGNGSSGGNANGNSNSNGSNAPKSLPSSSSIDKKKKIHAPSAAPAGTHTPTAKSKVAKKETKRRRKKPKDCPRRPLSAYNLFFKDERKRILNAIPGESEEMKKKKEEERPEITWPGKKKTPHRKIGFENLAKRIGQAWKDIDPEQLNYYKDLAVQDLQRYADEMKRYEKRLSFRKYCSDSDEDDDSHSPSRHSPSHSRKEKRKNFNTNTINDNDHNDSNKRRHENY